MNTFDYPKQTNADLYLEFAKIIRDTNEIELFLKKFLEKIKNPYIKMLGYQLENQLNENDTIENFKETFIIGQILQHLTTHKTKDYTLIIPNLKTNIKINIATNANCKYAHANPLSKKITFSTRCLTDNIKTNKLRSTILHEITHIHDKHVTTNYDQPYYFQPTEIKARAYEVADMYAYPKTKYNKPDPNNLKNLEITSINYSLRPLITLFHEKEFQKIQPQAKKAFEYFEYLVKTICKFYDNIRTNT